MISETKIKNYTTEVPAERSIAEIEKMLISVGADAIMKNYRGDGRILALAFKYQGRGYMLPSNSERCAEVIRKISEYRSRPAQWLNEQAERVAWRVLRDWVDSQLSLIRIGQAEVEQVLLPYMWDGKQSLYDKFKERNFMLQG